MSTILCGIILLGHARGASTGREESGRPGGKGLPTRRLVSGIVSYVWMVYAWQMTVGILWRSTQYDSAEHFVGILLLPVPAFLACWALARPFGRPQRLISVRLAGQVLNCVLIATAGLICVFFAASPRQIWGSSFTERAFWWWPRLLFDIVFSVAIVLSTAGFLTGVLARAGRGPWFAIIVTAISATLSHHLLWLLLTPLRGDMSWMWESAVWALIGTGFISWMRLRLGSIIPVGLFLIPAWVGLLAVRDVVLSHPSGICSTVVVGLFASSAVLICLGIGLSLRKPFAQTE